MLITEIKRHMMDTFKTKDRLESALAHVLDLKGLSHDLVTALVDKASKQKDVLIAALAREFSAFLSKINI